MSPVLQSRLPPDVWGDDFPKRLPGILPLKSAGWIDQDDAFAGQMALRDQLIESRPEDVLALHPDAMPAAQELLDEVLAILEATSEYSVTDSHVTRPDGVTVALERDIPMATLGRLVQEDLCLMQKTEAEHVLAGAVLCFPASWTLAEKFLRPLRAIHGPVGEYSHDMARRVQRLFDGIRVEQPLWRANGFYYDSPDLYAPCNEAEPRVVAADKAEYFRAEKQCLLRLPNSGAVVFSIHSYMVRRCDLTADQRRTFSRSAQLTE